MSAPSTEVGPSTEKDGLVGKVYCNNGLRYVYGYRAICLATNEEEADKVMAARLEPRTILVRVDSSPNSPPSIEIFCEEIIFVSGAKYCWPGKSLRIRCRKVSLISAEPAPVQFDLSGAAGDTAPKQPDVVPDLVDIESRRAKAPGLTVEERTEYVTGYMAIMTNHYNAAAYADDKPAVAAQPGKDGAKGVPGGRGHDAGDFELLAEEIDSAIAGHQGVFSITCKGGDGGNGQDGQMGTDGGAGLAFECGDVKEYDPPSTAAATLEAFFKLIHFNVMRPGVYGNLLRTFLGALGGVGGNGGPGGRGGNSGSITISPASLKAACQISASPGADGSPGQDGKSGATGSHSTSNIYKQPSWPRFSWEAYAEKMNETDTDGRALAMTINQWSQDGKEPEPKSAAAVTNLKGEDLWKQYPDDAQQETKDGVTRPDEVPMVELHKGYLSEPSFLQRVMDRLRFEHFIYFTCQPYGGLPSSPLFSGGGEVAKTRESMDWIMRVFQDVDANDPSPLVKSVYYAYTALAHTFVSTPTIDAFDNSTSFVPYTSSAASFEKTLADFELMEKCYGESAAVLAGQAQQRDVLQQKIDNARDLICSMGQAIEEHQKKAKDLADKFKTAAVNVEDDRKLLVDSVEVMRSEIERKVSCKLESILDALSSALMFTDMENPVAIAGAMLSVGSGTAKSVNESIHQVGGGDKSMLFARMDIMTKASKDLKDEIAMTVTANAQRFEQEKDARAQIVTDRAKFDAMVDQYFADLQTPAQVKKRFNELLKAVDRKNKILVDYNGAVMAVAKAQLDIHESQTLIAGLGVGEAALTDDELQFVGLFMSRAYEDMGRFAVRELYSRVRAFNCVSMLRSRAFDCLAPLNSFMSVTAAALQVASKTALQKDFHDLQARWVESPAVSKTVSVVMTDTDHPISFIQFAESRSITFDVDWDSFCPSLGDNAAWDLRLLQLSVYLVGAKIEQPAPSPPGTPATPALTDVQLHISSSGLFRYRDHDLRMHIFELPPTRVPFLHREITAPNPSKESFVPVGLPIKGEMFQLDFFDGVHDPVPLQSPLGVWTIEAVPGIDLGACHSIRFDFNVSYRV